MVYNAFTNFILKESYFALFRYFRGWFVRRMLEKSKAKVTTMILTFCSNFVILFIFRIEQFLRIINGSFLGRESFELAFHKKVKISHRSQCNIYGETGKYSAVCKVDRLKPRISISCLFLC